MLSSRIADPVEQDVDTANKPTRNKTQPGIATNQAGGRGRKKCDGDG